MTATTGASPFVVLGGDETGLAIVRNAAARRLRPVVIARPGDITTHSRLADCVVVDDLNAPTTLGMLRGFGSPTDRPPLVATNDRWLRFTMAHRGALEQCFTVLHPKNEVLDICLNKRRFAEWCSRHRIPTPALINVPHIADVAHLADNSLCFPLILRPEWSNQASPNRVPKASPVANTEELRATIRMFEAAGAAWVATRSLLPEARDQYSVAVAVSGDACLSFVAQKLRPFPDQCAVGSYVALRPHAGAESLARTLLRTVGFDFGVAEVEIIATASGELFVIEVNPRPWTQFALSYRSGHDLLGFLLDPAPVPPPVRRRAGLSWVAFRNDLFTCFSRSTGLVRHRRLTVAGYLRSLAQVRVFATFALNDPYPALHGLIGVAAGRLRSLHRRDTTDQRVPRLPAMKNREVTPGTNRPFSPPASPPC